MGVGESREVVLQSAVAKVERHQTSTHAQEQDEEDRHHHRRHVLGVDLSPRGVAGSWGERARRHQTGLSVGGVRRVGETRMTFNQR